jgi:cold shock CspA family protein
MREIGTVKEFREEKGGCGFIEAESGRRVFFHHKEVMVTGSRMLAVGTPVEFSIAPWEGRGVRAVNVRPF